MQRVRSQVPSTPGSPGAALVAMPPRKPGAALCVMPPKKRSKLDADAKEENGCDVKEPIGKVLIFKNGSDFFAFLIASCRNFTRSIMIGSFRII